MKEAIITVDHEKCTGCNKCIYVCPVKANVAKSVSGSNKVFVDNEKCILCGKCIKICDHKSRNYSDDTERFFNDLLQGTKISILAAPSVRLNFGDISENLFSFLKSKGAAGIYDVSFGADITTWGYLKALKSGQRSIISQPCPVVVDYVQKYQPNLLTSLAPVQSPVMCAAIYLREYRKISGKFAFLSPCICKSNEFADKNTGGMIEYNITFAKLKKYLNQNGIRLGSFAKSGFDGDGCGMGLLYSRPGGLCENIRYHDNSDYWIRQVEGTTHTKKYLDEFSSRITGKRSLPDIVDILNCEYGCNIGTGTENDIEIDEVDKIMNQLKHKVTASKSSEKDELFDFFDSTLDVSKFARRYEPHTVNQPEPDMSALEEIYISLNKQTEESRNINCFSCGYGSCSEFAKAVARGENYIENCANYNRRELSKKESIFKACESARESIDHINKSNDRNVSEISEITTNMKQLSDNAQGLKSSLETVTDSAEKMKQSTRELDGIARQTKLIALNALIEAAHAGKFGVTFGVVASEVRELAQKSEKAVNLTKSCETAINDNLSSTNKLFEDIDAKVSGIYGSINSISRDISSVDEKCRAVCSSLDSIVDD
ncbi:MAG TPA: [Fe-Fe] hydrogenase large subunit C-terminal domain-containing protein [Ruminiclostridium sp.]|nr:[Fe-Fe] hydrogenase large subunit C-terminal domain-containing protein [Ruminiclostridium sp.]